MKRTSMIEPRQRIEGHTHIINEIIHLPGGRRIISCSHDGSIRIWDLESGMQVCEAWKDEADGPVYSIALSPDGKKVASGSWDGKVRLWNIDTGKVDKKFTGHTKRVFCVCWSPDGGRVVSGSEDETFRVWDVESSETILKLAPKIENDFIWPVCGYSPDGDMIATDGDHYGLKIWDANTGKLLKTFDTLGIVDMGSGYSYRRQMEWYQEIRCPHLDICIWDVIEAGREDLLSDKDRFSPKPRKLIHSSQNTVKKPLSDADATRQGRPLIKDARRIPQGFFDDSPHVSLWRRHESHETTERNTISRPHPLSWPRHFVSGMSHKRNQTDTELQEIPVVDVPCTWAKPRNYHAVKKPSASSSQRSYPHTTHQRNATTQNIPSSSQGPPANATTSGAPPAVDSTTSATGTTSQRDIQAGCWIRFLLCICCVHTDDQH
ncbi:WD40-repeat-containing domain protein [Suillus bovinus]|uniref:WD40-repeat-containing domain protein n=1 Tax=Suillus bovinus TaxID=48563 RepID=UPI001B8634E6|nr:WD40-repeat-containing domain protein [Suillus bovinus]KAG2147772.1 WD40-repeat-containing domain protein [Suillus bovinus]